MSRWTTIRLILALSLLAAPISQTTAVACPFCAAVSQTFTEEINSMDAVVIAKLVAPPSSTSSDSDDVAKAKFEIQEVVKGGSHLSKMKLIETIYFGEAKVGQQFLIMGVDPPKLMWSTPLQLSARGKTYVSKLLSVPATGAERLEFFQDYLEDNDEMLARDAYDEFAKAPYAEIKAVKDKLKYENLVGWIKSSDVPASRRRLYLTLLGVCGTSKDLTMLEEMMKSTDRKQKAGLDALIGCYLTLKGAEGMPLVEDLFLKNKSAEYADTYAAIMALRFHATDGGVIEKQRVIKGLRHMLSRPQLADLVIPDLARWEDWSVMDKLVDLFIKADEKSSWVRVPVINYLRACPMPEAKEHIKKLEKVDPAAVKRAHNFFPVTPANKDKQQSNWQRPKKDEVAVNKTPIADEQPALAPPPVKKKRRDLAVAENVTAQNTATIASVSVPENHSMNPLLLVSVVVMTGSTLMLLLWTILAGTVKRAIA